MKVNSGCIQFAIFTTINLAILLGGHSALARTVYLDPYSKSTTSPDGSWNQPFKTLDSAVNKADGTSSNAYVIKLKYKTSFTDCATWVDKNYVVFEGLGSTVKCNNETPFKIANYAHHITIQNFRITSGIGSKFAAITTTEYSHHLTFKNNVLFDSGGGGVRANGSDYVTVSRNTVYGTAQNMSEYCLSGIMIYSPTDYDSYGGIRNRIDNNIVYKNTNTDKYGKVDCYHSDGNGIIVDDTKNTQQRWNGYSKNRDGYFNVAYKYRKANAYRGKTLVENNLTMGNGGRGIHIYYSNNVMVRHNTAFGNLMDPLGGGWRPGQISVVKSGNVQVWNNILSTQYRKTANNGEHVGVSITANSGPVSVKNNVLYVDAWGTAKPALEKYIGTSGDHYNSAPVEYKYNVFLNPYFRYAAVDGSADLFPTNNSLNDRGMASVSSSEVLFDFVGVKRNSYAPTPGAFEK